MAHTYVQVYETDLLVNASMGASLASDYFVINDRAHAKAVFAYSIHAQWSDGSSPVGQFKLQASNYGTEDSWVDINGTEVNVIANSGNAMWGRPHDCFKYVRLSYTRTSGSAILKVRFIGEGHNV